MCAVLLRYPFTTISILKFDKTPGNLTLPVIELLNDSGHLKQEQVRGYSDGTN